MKNIIYYLSKKGNIPLSEYPFNEVDGLILSQISYLNFGPFISAIEPINMLDIFRNKQYETLVEDCLTPKNNIKFIKMLAESTRYEDVKVGHLVDDIDVDAVKQFYAETFIFPDFLYIVFRGTDTSLNGWHEDFNMAFMNEVPAQKEAITYVRKIYEIYKKKIYIGGHSKGGNLAVYSAYHNLDIVDDIIEVHNFDGPGFSDDIYYRDDYINKLFPKVKNYSTQKAIIGVLLNHSDNLRFIKGKGFLILAHDPYNWILKKDCTFAFVKKNNPTSRFFARATMHFFEETSTTQREKFVDTLFKVIIAEKNSKVLDITKDFKSYYKGIKTRYKELPKVEKDDFKSILKVFRKCFPRAIGTKIKDIFGKKNKKIKIK